MGDFDKSFMGSWQQILQTSFDTEYWIIDSLYLSCTRNPRTQLVKDVEIFEI